MGRCGWEPGGGQGSEWWSVGGRALGVNAVDWRGVTTHLPVATPLGVRLGEWWVSWEWMERGRREDTWGIGQVSGEWWGRRAVVARAATGSEV